MGWGQLENVRIRGSLTKDQLTADHKRKRAIGVCLGEKTFVESIP